MYRCRLLIQQNVQFLPDVTAEWLINQTGSIPCQFLLQAKPRLSYNQQHRCGREQNVPAPASLTAESLKACLRFLKAKRKRSNQRRHLLPLLLNKPQPGRKKIRTVRIDFPIYLSRKVFLIPAVVTRMIALY